MAYVPGQIQNTGRLDSLLRSWGIAPKREIREMIAAGRITFNGEPVASQAFFCNEPGMITLDGKMLAPRPSVTVMLNKPAGYISVSEHAKYPSVFSLTESIANGTLIPVGRLDVDTEGLLLMTNDGMLSRCVAMPEAGISKRYYAELDRPLRENAAELAAAGILTENGDRFSPALLEPAGERSVYVTVREGQYHEVKRIIRACGSRVAALKRTAIGRLELDSSLAPGEYRLLSDAELQLIFE